MAQRLERSTANRVIAGVCGGLAEYFQIDATLVRAFFVLVALFTAGFGILAYIALLVLMPLPGRPPLIGPSAPSGDAGAAEGATQPTGPAATYDTERTRTVLAYGLIVLGVLFLIGNFGGFWFWSWRMLWPLLLVGLGVLLLVWQSRR